MRCSAARFVAARFVAARCDDGERGVPTSLYIYRYDRHTYPAMK